MKPLLKKDIPSFLERFCHFENGEISSFRILSPIEMQITIKTQDTSRDYDWCSITLLFHGIIDAKLLKDTQLTHFPMDDGISLLIDDDNFAFALGACYNIATLKHSSCYIITKTIKYQEKPF
jgi:hypothetical protein